MPMFEFVIAVTPPGGHTKRYHRGTVYCHTNDEAAAAEKAIQLASERFGFNLNQRYNCVMLKVSEYEES
ncbi:hypothetical protein [Pseudarthrobacter sp. fls2-241-R2A-168]|uniref:hypothetical protein n=1 Tax=Pseudarthrobacter sp. fls2-241-R2A-168 TaxID=3040304 RepID=UPI002556D183|nr:hypothetical protein [Pseudarthrobacter sp. fls2-241-R2A-168]